MVLGFCYHSPLNIDSMLPTGLIRTFDPLEKADIFYCKELPASDISGFLAVLIFHTKEYLERKQINIVDIDDNGLEKDLTLEDIKNLLEKKSIKPVVKKKRTVKKAVKKPKAVKKTKPKKKGKPHGRKNDNQVQQSKNLRSSKSRVH